jgi:predicted nucleic acid-binding protein
MIFVDTNVLVRYLVAPETDDYRRMSQQAADLFDRAGAGEIELFLSDAVVAELAHVLTSKLRAPVDGVATRLAALLRTPNLIMANREITLEALEIWRQRPSLGFVDSLGAAYGRQPGVQLATFDKGIPKIFGVVAWEFDGVDD